LMISGFIDGYKVTQDEQYRQVATKAARFILEEMRKDGDLVRIFHRKKSPIKGYSEDYAFTIQALIDLYEITFDIDWLKEADELNGRMIDQFWDEKNGGFFFTGKENEPLIARSKSPYDHATPSSNSVAIFNLIRLGHLTGEESLKQKAGQVLHFLSQFLSDHPSGFPHALSGLSFFLDPEEIGIIGSKSDHQTKSMLQEIYRTYLPNKILSLKEPREPSKGGWLPFLSEKGTTEAPTAFICKGFTCLPPVRSVKELKKILGEIGRSFV